MLAERRERSGIVYCGTHKAVEEVCEAAAAAWLRRHPLPRGAWRTQERMRNQEDFLYDRAHGDGGHQRLWHGH